MKVFVVQHCYQTSDGGEETKMIGVYSSFEIANKAIERLKTQPGFLDTPDCFFIDAYVIDEDNWKEGYLTTKPGVRPSWAD
jgi:hypothetical protein